MLHQLRSTDHRIVFSVAAVLGVIIGLNYLIAGVELIRLRPLGYRLATACAMSGIVLGLLGLGFNYICVWNEYDDMFSYPSALRALAQMGGVHSGIVGSLMGPILSAALLASLRQRGLKAALNAEVGSGEKVCEPNHGPLKGTGFAVMCIAIATLSAPFLWETTYPPFCGWARGIPMGVLAIPTFLLLQIGLVIGGIKTASGRPGGVRLILLASSFSAAWTLDKILRDGAADRILFVWNVIPLPNYGNLTDDPAKGMLALARLAVSSFVVMMTIVAYAVETMRRRTG